MKLKPAFLAATAISLCATMPSAAFAQDNADDAETASERGDTILVTGSRIQRQDFVAPSPIVTVNVDAIADSGRVSVDDYLKDLPQFTAGTGDFSNDSNGGTAGRATLNLRGLGPQRNLVLMNGRRLMSSGTDGAIDINTIPSLAIGGIEVISGGASATYGSDALSGVINFKTRTDLDGIDLSAQYTTLDAAGQDSFQIGGAFGTDLGDGRGNMLISAEYSDRGGVNQSQRPLFLNQNISSFTVYGRSRIGPNWISVNDDGTVFNQGTGVGYNGPTDLPFLIGDGGGPVGNHPSLFNWLQVPLERFSLFFNMDYDVGGGTNFYMQSIYTNSTATNVGNPPVIAGAPWIVTIPGTNPFLVEARANNPGQLGANGSPINVFQTRLSQFGTRVYETSNDTLQILAGFNGELGSSGLNWDVHASYGRATNDDRTISGAASVSALQALLNASDGGNLICSGGYNPFGGQDPLSDACLDFVERTPLNKTKLEQFVVEANLEGPLFQLPAGEARFALTSQYRKNDYDFDPDPDLATADIANLAASLPTSGSIEAIELGGEVLLPLISSDNFLQEVNLTLGYRFSDYNLAGSNSTYKAELDARLTDNLLLRGGYQRAVRAPNVGEYFLAGELRVVNIGAPPSGGDPCDFRNAPSGDNLAVCAFQGVPLNGAGTNTTFRAATGSLPALTQGNRNLVPEKADTFTMGAVLDVPLGAANLQFSIDYYNIKIEDAIGAISASDSLNRCYNASSTATPGFDPAAHIAGNPFCQNFGRNPGAAGEPQDVVQPIVNLGGLQTDGIDFAVFLDVPADFLAWGGGDGAISLSTNVNYLLSYKVTTFADSPVLDFAGTISTNALESFPEIKALTSLSVESGPLDLIFTWRFTSSMDDRALVTNPALTLVGAPTYSLFDLTTRFDVTEEVELFAGVNNLFDKDPPNLAGNVFGTNLGTYDVIGRTFFVGARARF